MYGSRRCGSVYVGVVSMWWEQNGIVIRLTRWQESISSVKPVGSIEKEEREREKTLVTKPEFSP